MSTQTLAKPRQEAAQDAPRASIMASPANLYPARVRLSAKLSEFERACSDLDDFQAKAARAVIDEDSALENAELSENEAAERIAKARALKDTYQARIGNRKKALTILFGELEKAVVAAQYEYQPLYTAELRRVKKILLERACAAIKADPNRPEWERLLDFSEPYRAVYALRPSPYVSLKNKLPWTEPEQNPVPELVEVWKIGTDGGMHTERVPAPINHDALPDYSHEQITGPARQTLEMYTRLEAQKREAF